MATLTKAQMLALLADNTTGDISAQDMRDIVTGTVVIEDEGADYDADITALQKSVGFTVSLGVDIDTIISSGKYQVDLLGGGTYPPNVSSSLELDVIEFISSSKVVQYMFDTYSGIRYDRVSNDGISWTAWEVIKNSASKSDVLNFTPKSSDPAYSEGNVYYKDGTLNVQGAYSDVTLQVGREQQIEVINNTAATITNGSICRHDGIAGGNVQIELALSATFTNARVLGIATHDILSGQKGMLTTFGIVRDVDTTGYAVGIPLYLSDTVAGAITDIAPDIATQIGGSITQDALTGSLFISIENTINLPNTQAYLQEQSTGIYNLVKNTPMVIDNYVKFGDLVMDTNPNAGTIGIIQGGVYNLNFTFSGTTTVEKQSIDFQVYNVSTGTVLYTHTLPTGRDLDNGKIATSFTVPGTVVDNTVLTIRAMSDADMTLTIEQVNFSVNSLHIR